MSANSFTWRWALTLLALIAFIGFFPLILGSLVGMTGCQRTGGACGAVAMIFGIYLRAPVVLGVGIYLVWLAARRSWNLGLGPWGAIFVFAAYLGSAPALFFFGNFWAASFAMGMVAAPSLVMLGFLLAALVGLSCLPDAAADRGSRERVATFAVGAATLVFTAPMWLMSLAMLPFLGSLVRSILFPVSAMLAPIYRLAGNYGALALLIAFVIALALWIVAARQAPRYA